MTKQEQLKEVMDKTEIGEVPALNKVEINKDEILTNAMQLEEFTDFKAQKTYHSIVRHGKSGTHLTVEEGANIVVQEKLDGANASFKIENGILRVFSRRQELNEHQTLNGFYGWVKENIDPSKLLPNFIYFGEWLTKHTIDYGEGYMKNFYLFDVYNEMAEEYCDFEDVEAEAEALGINLVPVHYIGKAKDFAHLESFVGQSLLNPEVKAEGVVVKNAEFKRRDGKQIFTKIVSKEFAEAVPQKLPKAPVPPSEERLFVDKFLTEARVEKLLHKLVDEGIVDELAIENMGVILKNTGNRVYNDMIEEEVDELSMEFDEKSIKKAIGKVLPIYVKKVLIKVGGM
jgi:predicted transposase YbfD/YdcC